MMSYELNKEIQANRFTHTHPTPPHFTCDSNKWSSTRPVELIIEMVCARSFMVNAGNNVKATQHDETLGKTC